VENPNMRKTKRLELHVVIDKSGIKAVQIYGDPEAESEGQEMYYRIKDLLPEWNKEIQEIFKNDETEVVGIIH
jgi:hypothetical protein